MLYFIIIGATMVVTTVSAVAAAVVYNSVSLWHALVPITANFYVLIVLGIVSFLMRYVIPKKFWTKKRKCFKVWRKERTFYDRIKIKSWKDKVPEMGKVAGFPKDSLRSVDPAYLHRFIAETCFAEWMHFIAGMAGFTALCFCPVQDFIFVLPVLIVNLILHLLPCMIQRYNRLRLTAAVERLRYKTGKTDENRFIVFDKNAA